MYCSVQYSVVSLNRSGVTIQLLSFAAGQVLPLHLPIHPNPQLSNPCASLQVPHLKLVAFPSYINWSFSDNWDFSTYAFFTHILHNSFTKFTKFWLIFYFCRIIWFPVLVLLGWWSSVSLSSGRNVHIARPLLRGDDSAPWGGGGVVREGFPWQIFTEWRCWRPSTGIKCWSRKVSLLIAFHAWHQRYALSQFKLHCRVTLKPLGHSLSYSYS